MHYIDQHIARSEPLKGECHACNSPVPSTSLVETLKVPGDRANGPGERPIWIEPQRSGMTPS